MSIILHYVFRNIMKSKLRSIIIIISLMLSTVVLYSTLMVRDSITEYYIEQSQVVYKGYDLVASSDENELLKKNELDLGNTTVLDKLPMTMIAGKYSDNNISYISYQADIEKLIADKLITINDKLANWDKSDKNSAILSEDAVKKNGLTLGDTIKVRFPNGEKEFIIAALAADKGLFKNETTSNMLSFSPTYSITDEETGYNQIYIKLGEKEKLADVSKIIEKNNKHTKVVQLYNEDNVNSIINNTSNLLFVILIAIIAANFFVISSLMKLMMAERVTVIGTFQCIGANNKWIRKVMFLENSFYGVLGGTLGVLVAQILYRPIIQAFTGMKDFQFKVNIVYLVGSVVFAIVLQLIFVLKTIIETSRRDVMENVFNKVSTTVKSKMSNFIVGVAFLVVALILYYLNGTYNFFIAGIELVLGLIGVALVIEKMSDFLIYIFSNMFRQRYMHMGIRNISKNKSSISNVKLITMSLSIVYVVYIASYSLGTYFERATISQVGNDYVVSGFSKAFNEYEVFNDELVTDTIVSYVVSGTVKVNKESYSGVTIAGMDSPILGVEDKSDVIKGLKSGEVVVDSLFLKKFGYKVGDQLNLSSELFKDSRIVKMKIVGEVETGVFNTNRNTIIFSMDDFFKNITEIPNKAYIAVKEDSAENNEKIEKLFNDENLFLTLTEDYIKSQEDSVNQVLNLLNVLIGLTLFLVFIGIICNQLVGFIQRKKEYAVLMSIALSIKQMRRVMLSEIFFNALTGAILGTIGGLLLCLFLEQIMYAIGIAVPIIVDPQKMIVLFGVVVLLILLTAVLPIKSLSKLDIIEEIKKE